MLDSNVEITRLLARAVETGLIEKDDEIYCANRIIALIGAPEYKKAEIARPDTADVQEILDNLLEIAFANGKLESNTPVYRDLLDTEIMAVLTPFPSTVRRKFALEYEKSPQAATEWYYAFSKATNYIRVARIEKDLRWKYQSEFGELDVTINCSKPEKDPVAIAALLKQKSVSYPACPLCAENEGYTGRLDHAARGSHRVLPITLGGEDWLMQYSPYSYYNEHCIALNGNHQPMKISKATFEKLIDFVDLFPHYFIGSNADLPIVGGSILTHDHFQGGRYVFPMEKAASERTFKVKGYDNVTCARIAWPASVIRLDSPDRESLLELAGEILSAWRGYSDPDAGIFAETDGVPHNTISPIARRRGELYELDLALRNNITSEEHPLGVFHPHAELHHIKKETIGLIELMGLAVLPARLVGELAAVKHYLLEDPEGFYGDEKLQLHRDWYDTLRKRTDITPETIDRIIDDEVGEIFTDCLRAAGVYKRTPEGLAAFDRFIEFVQNR
ncbi:MAG: UDP-glucose--hexose-1-phosphate uridylyltransferase [Clostridia bacterium]|nr:UDP-glucose--hexose-1-phosphate uridylyltransferase [Clostridia bacterium]